MTEGGDVGETLRRRRTIYAGRVLTLHVDDVVLADGTPAVREIVDHRGSVVVVPILGNDVVLVRQGRYAVSRSLLELPAGTREAGEAEADCAARELAEETGYRPDHLEDLGFYYPSPGYTTEGMHFFLARRLVPEARTPDADERIEVVAMPLATAFHRARTGGFRDLKTTAGLLLVAARRGPAPSE